MRTCGLLLLARPFLGPLSEGPAFPLVLCTLVRGSSISSCACCGDFSRDGFELDNAGLLSFRQFLYLRSPFFQSGVTRTNLSVCGSLTSFWKESLIESL